MAVQRVASPPHNPGDGCSRGAPSPKEGRPAFLFPLFLSVLVSQNCCNRVPQARRFKPTEVFFSSCSGAGSPYLRHRQNCFLLEDLGDNPSVSLFQLLVVAGNPWRSLAWREHHSNLVSVFISSSSLCVSVSP